MWEIEFYETPDGSSPAQEFLDGLHKITELPFAIHKLNRLEEDGPNLRRPEADFLRDKIYELRIPIKRNQFRMLYFFFYNERIIISHGIHKYDKVPSGEIEKAIQHREDYYAKHTRKKDVKK